MKLRWLAVIVLLVLCAVLPGEWSARSLKVGAKEFTESIILAELVTQLARTGEQQDAARQTTGGTRIVFEALAAGEIGIYPEYTGTIRQEIFSDQEIETTEQMRAALAERGIKMSPPLGFNNTYALGMRERTATERGIESISDLAGHPDLQLGFTNEFLDRADGWPSLRAAYRLPHQDVPGMEHELAYRLLENGELDVLDVYSTDANIAYYGLRVLKDDRQHFPEYQAAFLYREELEQTAPELIAQLNALAGKITPEMMINMNRQATIDKQPPRDVAATFLRDELQIEAAASGDQPRSVAERIMRYGWEHVNLVRRSLAMAILVGIPLGIFAARYRLSGQAVLIFVGLVQTIPALALLALLIEPAYWFGLKSIGMDSAPAIAALFLYSLLPIVRGTHAGLQEIGIPIRESADALGLSPWAKLTRIELPLAARVMLSGVKTAAVINVGFATLGALIGAGGFGQPILAGIRVKSYATILEGAIPAALLALAVQGIFEIAERLIVPRGMRVKRSE